MAAEPINAEVLIDASPERVFEYLTRPEAIVQWMGEYALLEPVPDGRFELNVKGTLIRGRYLEVDPPHRLLISWGYAGSEHLPPGASTVELQLTADGDGTRVVLEHRDLPEQETQNHASGWTHYLARLQTVAANGHAGPDPGMPSAACA
jgi:uncharacterized protein YndB with AHSA1/START domain